MKNFFFLLTLAALFTACGGPEGQAVDSADAQEETVTEMVASAQYNVDAAASVVNWEGAKIAYGHTGTVPVSNGQIIVSKGTIVGGKFSLDLREMASTDLEGKKAEKLLGHLKNADFFNVDTFPMADFVITQVQEATSEEDARTHAITGNLTLRGQSRSITIPATVAMEGGMLKATTPKFTIDRTQWGVKYSSSGIAGILKDDIINDNIGLEIMLVANK